MVISQMSNQRSFRDFVDGNGRILPPGYLKKDMLNVRAAAIGQVLCTSSIIPASITIYASSGVEWSSFFDVAAGMLVMSSFVIAILWAIMAWRLLDGHLADRWDRFVTVLTIVVGGYGFSLDYGGSFLVHILSVASWLGLNVLGHWVERRAWLSQDLSSLTGNDRLQLASTFGKVLQELRSECQMSRRDLGKMSSLTEWCVQQLETGNWRPTTMITRRLARALSLSPMGGNTYEIDMSLRIAAGQLLRYSAKPDRLLR